MPSELLASYAAATTRFDELLQAPLRPRPHWSRLFSMLSSIGPQTVHERLGAVERQVQDVGITYNVYADPKGLNRPWALDPLPMVIPAQEWADISAGIAQRARLLNAILADIYGPQRLLREGMIPPSLVFGPGGFVRAAHGTKAPGGVFLHLYAADLARSPDGRWWVLSDRTQAPSGAGYALENRLIVSEVFPQLYREMQVDRLAGFFVSMRTSMARLAPKGDGPTLTVLLTPGPYNETYFEHAMLARYLGFPLVEGGDLIVRDGKVWLKTLEGPRRVHAILRRLDEDFCDPLELRSDSALGVPGLTDCMRRGTVLLANALGTGILESGSLLGFLPALCHHLLGEPLKLPSVATWWCGEPAALQDAFNRFESLVFKPATPAFPFEPIFGQDLSAEDAERFRAKVSEHPERYVAQELVHLSLVPVLEPAHGGQLAARAMSLRVFAAAASDKSYAVMPGGLSRVSARRDVRVVSMQRGGASKDTWVLAPGPVNTALSLLNRTVGPADLVRTGTSVSSRVAENLFWFGRYSGRSENAARLLRVALNTVLTEPDEDPGATSALTLLCRRVDLLADDEAADPALLEAASLEERPAGLAQNLRLMSRAGFTLRDRISIDHWRMLNRLIQDQAFDRELSLSEALRWLDRVIGGLMTLAGFVLDGMTRDTGWRFLSIGRRLERLSFGCLALQTAMAEGRESDLSWLLGLADSTITYRARYMGSPEWLPVLDLLMLDGNNPRAVMFQVKGIVDYLRRLETHVGPCGCELIEPLLERLQSLDPGTDLDPDGLRLHALIAELGACAFALGERLNERVFSHGDGDRLRSIGA
jgi:uncharacterized circularly permuted ATP-grasp superfamily protein/uncharacterized alpha-E superfamily protein